MKKTLLETNAFLKDPTKRAKAMARNIETSSAIEGIRVKRDSVSGRFVSQEKEVKLPPSKKPSKKSR